MTSFKFPPPPPPPPKASTGDAQELYSSQRGGHNSRGDRGRGRGFQGRGRGSDIFRGGSRGGQSHGDGRGNAHPRGGARRGSRGGHQNQGRDAFQQQNLPQSPYRQHQQQSPPPADGSLPNIQPVTAPFVNPSFPNQAYTVGQPQVDPKAFAQAMAFMSTPAGVQTMAAFATHMANGASATTQSLQSPPPQQVQAQLQNQQASLTQGKKRKRNDNVPNKQGQPIQKPQLSLKPSRAKAAAPPPVPSFGFSLPPAPASSHPLASRTGSRDNVKKGKVNLGLTHQGLEPVESSDEEDIDEEAAFAKNVKVEGVEFEHNGESISLQTPAEVASWIKERRRNFPTRRRIEEKAQKAAEQRTEQLNFLRRLSGKPVKKESATQQHVQPQRNGKGKEQQKRKEHEQFGKNIRESFKTKTAIASEKTPTVDLGLGYSSETESDDGDSSELEESSVVSSSEESSADSDSDSGTSSDDSDAPPETQSSKVPLPKINVLPRPPAQSVSELKPNNQRKACDYWEKTGRCKYGNRCRNLHPPKEEQRIGLYEKMVKQEQEKADRLALDAIKYLGRHGFLG